VEIAQRIIAHPYFKYGVLYGVCIWLLVRMLLLSWVSEDAYITFRVIDNFINDYGLRWNVAERVQAYTHPLWLLIHLPLASLWPNLYLMNIALSLFCSVAAVVIVLATFLHKPLSHLLLFFLVPLLLSKCFIDYSTSGLETSLSFLLFALIGYVVIKLREHRFFWLFFSLTTSLLLFNRLDHMVLIAPMFITLFLKDRPRLKHILIGALPLIVWFSFSFFYYGFLFPNTKYAKLNTGFPLSDYAEQGMNYAFIWLTNDTTSVLLLISSLIVLWVKRKSATPLFTSLGVGLVLNVAYVIYIGGDYMMGRFWAVPFFVACWMMLALAKDNLNRDMIFVWAIALATSYAVPSLIAEIRTPCPTCVPIAGRVIDARGIFWRNHLFISSFPPLLRMQGEYKFGRQGRELAREEYPPVKVQRFIGMIPYYVGAKGTYIDELGLADPLLARLPADTGRTFYVGHYRRLIPKGYIDAVRSNGELSRMNPDLAVYYEKLRIITREELWNKERLMTIIRFNLGQYDEYKQRYLAKP